MNANKPLVSIIVPFYNPNHFFNDLLNSLSEQSYSNLEIILVDDGSDKVFNDIAATFTKSHPNSFLLKKENGGVASARQAGIDLASGELIMHADADDLIPDYAIEKMVDKLVSTSSDMVVGGYIIKDPKHSNYIDAPKIISYWDYVEGLLDGTYHNGLWNKLIKKELYASIKFEPGLNYMEDKLFLSKILINGPYKIIFLNEPIYIYRQHASSLTSQLSIESINSTKIITDEIIKLYQNKYNKDFLLKLHKKQRAFEIIQYAKLGLDVYEKEDGYLRTDRDISLKYRILLSLIGLNLTKYIKALSNLKIKN